MGIRLRKATTIIRTLATGGILGHKAQELAIEEQEARKEFLEAKDELRTLVQAIKRGEEPQLSREDWQEIGEFIRAVADLFDQEI